MGPITGPKAALACMTIIPPITTTAVMTRAIPIPMATVFNADLN